MIKSIVKSAKTIDEAISLGLSELGLERDQVYIEVLQEPKKKFFGIFGTTEAKVKIVEIEETEEIEMPEIIAEEFLKSVFDKMNIKCNFEITKKKSDISINIIDINSDDKGIVIGKRGNTLDSLQYLVSLLVNKESDKYVRITLDVGNYRLKREDTLRALAKKMASKAKSIDRPVKLEPMNPYERRIIHATLQKDKAIKTFSEGKDPYRRIVIEKKIEK